MAKGATSVQGREPSDSEGCGSARALLEPLSNMWDESRHVRERVRLVGRLLVNKPMPGTSEEATDGVIYKTVDNLKYNAHVLSPLAKVMSKQRDALPEVKALQGQIQHFFEANGYVPTAKVLSDQAWSFRHLFNILKGFKYRERPPKEACHVACEDFLAQDAILLALLREYGVDPDVQWQAIGLKTWDKLVGFQVSPRATPKSPAMRVTWFKVIVHDAL